MKIRLPNIFLIIDVLVILLIASITLFPAFGLRVVLGLPFLLLFPGFVLVAALFPKKDEMDGLERLALSFGMSIPVVALIVLGLNYTPWGIRLTPVLYSVSAFILVMSGIAMWQRRRLNKKSEIIIDVKRRLPGWEGSTLNKALSVVLLVAILGTIGVLGYAVAKPKVGEKFTEFYILGINGKAQDYPSGVVLSNGRVVRVTYGSSANETGQSPIPNIQSQISNTESQTSGLVTVGIVNREHQDTAYSVRVIINGEPAVAVPGGTNGTNADAFGTVTLAHEEKLEQRIGIAPSHAGNDQKVEFVLYKDSEPEPYLTLHLWIDVRDEGPLARR